MKRLSDFYFRGRRYSIDETERSIAEYAHAYNTTLKKAVKALSPQINKYALEDLDLENPNIEIYLDYLKDQVNMDKEAIRKLIIAKLFAMVDNSQSYKACDMLKVYEMLMHLAGKFNGKKKRNPLNQMSTDELKRSLETLKNGSN